MAARLSSTGVSTSPPKLGELPIADVVQHEDEDVAARRSGGRGGSGQAGEDSCGGAPDDAGEGGSFSVGLECHAIFSFHGVVLSSVQLWVVYRAPGLLASHLASLENGRPVMHVMAREIL